MKLLLLVVAIVVVAVFAEDTTKPPETIPVVQSELQNLKDILNQLQLLDTQAQVLQQSVQRIRYRSCGAQKPPIPEERCGDVNLNKAEVIVLPEKPPDPSKEQKKK